MFGRSFRRQHSPTRKVRAAVAVPPTWELLEGRQLLSAVPLGLVPTDAGDTLPGTLLSGSVLHKGTFSVDLTNSTAHGNYGSTSIELWATTDGQVDANSLLLAHVRRSLPVPPGRSHVQTLLVPRQKAPPIGAYTILAQTTDAAQEVVTATTGPMLDVEVPTVALSAAVGRAGPASVPVGRSFAFNVTLINTGNIDAVGKLTTAIGLSSDGATVATPLTITTHPVRIRNGGNGESLRLAAKVTAANPGTYFVAVTFTLTNGKGVVTGAPFTSFGTVPITVSAAA